MPKLKLEYSLKVNDPVAIFGERITTYNKDKPCIQPHEKFWLAGNPSHADYNVSNIKETYKNNGNIYQIKQIQDFLYNSLKDAISKTELVFTYNDEEQSLTIFGVKIFPTTICTYPNTTWYNNVSYMRQFRAWPMVLKDGDVSMQINSFCSHAFDNSSMLSAVISGSAYSSAQPYFWEYTSSNEQSASMIPYTQRTYGTLNDGCIALNDIRVSFVIYYNTDYVLVNYRCHNSILELPLFCLVKGAIQDTAKTPIVYCCTNPNDVRNYADIRSRFYSTQAYTTYSNPCHSLVIPSNPQTKLLFDAEITKYSAPIETKFCNAYPYFLDWRNTNYQVEHLINANKDEITHYPFFIKQNVTAFSGAVQFSDNIIYADENCVCGCYYEIDGAQYYCPSNSLLDEYISRLGTSVNNYYLYNRRVLFKL